MRLYKFHNSRGTFYGLGSDKLEALEQVKEDIGFYPNVKSYSSSELPSYGEEV